VYKSMAASSSVMRWEWAKQSRQSQLCTSSRFRGRLLFFVRPVSNTLGEMKSFSGCQRSRKVMCSFLRLERISLMTMLAYLFFPMTSHKEDMKKFRPETSKLRLLTRHTTSRAGMLKDHSTSCRFYKWLNALF
jgi:hypothetical protein